MRINVQSYNHISEGERFLQGIAEMVEQNLSRFGGRLTRVDVLLIEEDDHRRHNGCVIEAQLDGLEPIAVRAQAGTLTRAVTASAEKMEEVIDHALADESDHEADNLL